MTDRMPEFTHWPGGLIRKPTPIERKARYYHGFHDTPDVDCLSCAWEQAI